MAKDASFDIVSEVNTEEVKNAIQQTTFPNQNTL